MSWSVHLATSPTVTIINVKAFVLVDMLTVWNSLALPHVLLLIQVTTMVQLKSVSFNALPTTTLLTGSAQQPVLLLTMPITVQINVS